MDSIQKDDKVRLQLSKDKVFPVQVSCLQALTRSHAAVGLSPNPAQHADLRMSCRCIIC